MTHGPSAKGFSAVIDGHPECSRADVEKGGGIRQVYPGLLLVWLIAWDAMMAAQRSNSFACPAVSTLSEVTVTVQNASDEIIARNPRQNGDCFNQFAGCLGATLATAAAWETQFRVKATFPMQGKNQFSL